MRFPDRSHAGVELADTLRRAGVAPDVVLGLPRGGVPVAFEVSDSLGVPLDVIVVRKLGVPFQPELAMGALGEGGVRVENHEVLQAAGLDEAALDLVADRATRGARAPGRRVPGEPAPARPRGEAGGDRRRRHRHGGDGAGGGEGGAGAGCLACRRGGTGCLVARSWPASKT